MIVKFDSSSVPAYVIQDFLIDDKVTLQQVIGYRVFIDGDIRIEHGDFLEVDGQTVKRVIKSAVYASDPKTKQEIKEYIGKECLREIWKALDPLSNAVKASILNTISATLVSLLAGEVQVAKIIATGTATTVDFTNGRKNGLIALIDESILKL